MLANHRRFLARTLSAAIAMVGLVHLAPAASGDDHLTDSPIVRDIFTADPAALVHDGRMYIYTGRDEASPGVPGP